MIMFPRWSSQAFRRDGVALVERLAADIEAIENVKVATGVIDVSMHRDDVGTRARSVLSELRSTPYAGSTDGHHCG